MFHNKGLDQLALSPVLLDCKPGYHTSGEIAQLTALAVGAIEDEGEAQVRGKKRIGQMRPGAARAKWGISVVALLVLMAVSAGSSSAMRFGISSPRHFTASPVITAKQHEGQKSDSSYTSGNITTYKEGDTIKFRFDLTGSDASSGQLQVRFSENDGTCLFFENYFVLQEITNVSGATPTVAVASGPTADSGEWVVTLDVAFSGAGEAVVNYQLKLSDQAGDCNGSSQHSRLSPGDGVSQTGQQNVPVPANQIIEVPNITVAKLVDRADGAGFVPAAAGEYCFMLDSGACTPIDSSGQVVFVNVADGAHTITESSNLAHPGYTFDSGVGTNCTFDGSTATATVAQGTTATNASCTFKNKLTAPPKVTVTKSCPTGAATSGDRFQVRLNGVDAGTALACGGSIDVAPTPGQAYSVTEAAAGTTDFANYTSSLGSGCAGTLTFGGTATCTITNTRKAAPKVTVTKSCPGGPANAGDRFQIKLNGGNSGDALACGAMRVDAVPGVRARVRRQHRCVSNGRPGLRDHRGRRRNDESGELQLDVKHGLLRHPCPLRRRSELHDHEHAEGSGEGDRDQVLPGWAGECKRSLPDQARRRQRWQCACLRGQPRRAGDGGPGLRDHRGGGGYDRPRQLHQLVQRRLFRHAGQLRRYSHLHDHEHAQGGAEGDRDQVVPGRQGARRRPVPGQARRLERRHRA